LFIVALYYYKDFWSCQFQITCIYGIYDSKLHIFEELLISQPWGEAPDAFPILTAISGRYKQRFTVVPGL